MLRLVLSQTVEFSQSIGLLETRETLLISNGFTYYSNNKQKINSKLWNSSCCVLVLQQIKRELLINFDLKKRNQHKQWMEGLLYDIKVICIYTLHI